MKGVTASIQDQRVAGCSLEGAQLYQPAWEMSFFVTSLHTINSQHVY